QSQLAIRTVSGRGRATIARIPTWIGLCVRCERFAIVMRDHREKFAGQERGAEIAALIRGERKALARLSVYISHWRKCLRTGSKTGVVEAPFFLRKFQFPRVVGHSNMHTSVLSNGKVFAVKLQTGLLRRGVHDSHGRAVSDSCIR